MKKAIDVVGTIFAPENDGIIEKRQFHFFFMSLFRNNISTKLDLAHHNLNMDTDTTGIWEDFINLYKISDEEYINRRDYFKIENTKRLILKYSPALLAVLDIDMLIANPIILEDNFDIAFTLKLPWQSEIHPINLGTSFFNIKATNKHDILRFMDGWLDAPISRDNEVYNEYTSLPAIQLHKKYEMDRIVHQDYICALAWKYKWFEEGIYEYNNLRIKLLGHKYNHTWRFNDPLDEDVSIYHLRGEKQSKIDRTMELYEKI
jgi:hypothetical protein